jgi:hypothetical protein
MFDRWRAVLRVGFSVPRNALGALALCSAVVVPMALTGTAPAGASPPTINFVLTGNLSTGTTGTTLSGTAFLDAGVTDTSQIVQVSYFLLPQQTFCPPPITNPCPTTTVAQGTRTPYGWFGEWNTTTFDNGTYQLEAYAEDTNASGTVLTETQYGPIQITIDNPPPTTSVLVPSSGATVSGTELLDASASCKNGQVQFDVTGPEPDDPISDQAVALAVTSSPYGYLAYWNTAEVPNGAYTLWSVADCFVAQGFGTSPPITITVDNPPPTTAVLIPSNGSTESGTAALLDAKASSGMNDVNFEVSGGTLSNQVIATGTPTVYGWLAQWNTTAVSDGTYTLQSVAYFIGGVVAATSPPITITVGN